MFKFTNETTQKLNEKQFNLPPVAQLEKSVFHSNFRNKHLSDKI